MPMMKTLMQTMKPSFIGAYKKNFNRLPRAASFTGTSNSRELLTDRTGSRRFLNLEPDSITESEGHRKHHHQHFQQNPHSSLRKSYTHQPWQSLRHPRSIASPSTRGMNTTNAKSSLHCNPLTIKHCRRKVKGALHHTPILR